MVSPVRIFVVDVTTLSKVSFKSSTPAFVLTRVNTLVVPSPTKLSDNACSSWILNTGVKADLDPSSSKIESSVISASSNVPSSS